MRRGAIEQRERPEQGFAEGHAALPLGGLGPDCGDAIERAFGGAAIAFGDFPRGFAHAFAHCVVLDQLDPDFAEALACGDLNSCVRVEKLLGHLVKIFHGRAEDWRAREPGRLQNIVAARGNERAADEGSVGKRVQARQLADGIEQQHVSSFVECGREVQIAAADDFPTALCGDGSGGIELRGFPRRQNQKRAPPLALHQVVGREHVFFFSSDNAAGDQHGPAFLLANLLLEPGTEAGDRGRLGVVLQISGDRDAVLLRAHGEQPRGVLGRLREEKLGVLHGALEKRADQEFPTLETRERFFGDTGVREYHGNIGPARFAQKIRPDFRFHDDDERRTNRAQRATHRNDPIQRKVKDAVSILEALPRQALACFRSGGNKNGGAGKATLQAVDQRPGGENFAHRDGVNPDGASTGGSGCASGDFGWQASQSFAQRTRRFAGAPSPQCEIRREEKHARRREDAIEKIHSVGVAHSSRERGFAARRPGIIVAATTKHAQLPAPRRHRTAG